ncbi:hypothetical protein ACFL96_00275 [Thermoproteota archaeon]
MRKIVAIQIRGYSQETMEQACGVVQKLLGVKNNVSAYTQHASELLEILHIKGGNNKGIVRGKIGKGRLIKILSQHKDLCGTTRDYNFLLCVLEELTRVENDFNAERINEIRMGTDSLPEHESPQKVEQALDQVGYCFAADERFGDYRDKSLKGEKRSDCKDSYDFLKQKSGSVTNETSQEEVKELVRRIVYSSEHTALEKMKLLKLLKKSNKYVLMYMAQALYIVNPGDSTEKSKIIFIREMTETMLFYMKLKHMRKHEKQMIALFLSRVADPALSVDERGNWILKVYAMLFASYKPFDDSRHYFFQEYEYDEWVVASRLWRAALTDDIEENRRLMQYLQEPVIQFLLHNAGNSRSSGYFNERLLYLRNMVREFDPGTGRLFYQDYGYLSPQEIFMYCCFSNNIYNLEMCVKDTKMNPLFTTEDQRNLAELKRVYTLVDIHRRVIKKIEAGDFLSLNEELYQQRVLYLLILRDRYFKTILTLPGARLQEMMREFDLYFTNPGGHNLESDVDRDYFFGPGEMGQGGQDGAYDCIFTDSDVNTQAIAVLRENQRRFREELADSGSWLNSALKEFLT